MNATEISRTRLHPTTQEDVQLIRNELEAVLMTPHFASSKRYPAFLSYVVEKTLEGEATDLKERTLGVEVFHRRPDYDTNSDTIVRFAAGEVRKRLALVYHEHAADHPVRIVLAAGSYTPEFFRVSPDQAAYPAASTPPEPPQVTQPAVAERAGASTSTPARAWRRGLVLPVAACLLAFAWIARLRLEPTPLDRFWQPMLSAANPILLSPGAMVFSPALATVTRADKTVDYPYVSYATADSLTDLVAVLARSKNRYVIEPSSSLTLTEMRNRPVVLLGAYNNDWTLRALSELRFRFSPQAALNIYDATNPAVTWTRPPSVPYSEADDYAIVARFHPNLTEGPMLVLAGVGKNGTEAATQFVTDPRYLSALDPSLPKGWADKNIEFVIKSKVIDGRTGEPTLVAVHVW